MEMIRAITDEMKRSPFIRDRMMAGDPPRFLHSYFYLLALKRYGIEVRHPLDIRNWAADYFQYTLEEEVYGKKEYWLQNTEDVHRFFVNRKGDCEDISIVEASVGYTQGNNHIRLALGYLGDKPEIFPNHAYCIYEDGIKNNEPVLRLMEATGDSIINELPLLEECERHHTLISCNALGNYWLHGAWSRI